jgi:anti-sigma regulatory factor (Ser/Thr protein kinase)
MKIHLPNSAFLGNIDPFIRSFDPSNPTTLEITANEKWISVHPLVLCMVAALGLRVAGHGEIQCNKFQARSKHYLERMGLYKFLGLQSDSNIIEHEAAGRFIPLTQIKTSAELTNFITEMIPLLHVEPKRSESIAYIVSESVRNVLEHAAAEDGAILAAQYYKKTNSIRIGIADTGRGIKTTINYSYAAPSHLEAIRLALSPGITGTTRKEGGTEQNAGAGLFFIKSIASVNGDHFMIYSGDSMYKLLKTPESKRKRLNADPFHDRYTSEENMPYWQGTAIGIDITLDQTTEFSLLLDLVRKTYGAAIRERIKSRYKKPKFI